MARVTVDTVINAPKEQVWATLADIGSIHKWNPGVSNSYTTSDLEGGEGATRHCDLTGSNNYLEERAFDWQEGAGFSIDIYDTNLPLKSNVVRFDVSEAGDGTRVTLTSDYQLKFGPIGLVMDALFARRQAEQGFRGLLAGLKHHIETGETVGDELPEAALA